MNSEAEITRLAKENETFQKIIRDTATYDQSSH